MGSTQEYEWKKEGRGIKVTKDEKANLVVKSYAETSRVKTPRELIKMALSEVRAALKKPKTSPGTRFQHR